MVTGSITLLYQLVCTRIAIIHFGAEAETIAAVVCMTLIGLSSGAFWAGRIDGRHRSRARVLTLFLLGCFLVQLLIWCSITQLAAGIQHRGLPVQIQRLAFAAVVLLPTNLLLGTVLPMLAASTDWNQRPLAFAGLYAAETLGAGLGAILSAFYLIPMVGVDRTQLIACVMTLGTAILALLFCRQVPCHDPAMNLSTGPRNNTRSVSLAAVLLVGASSMGIEIVWQRFFVLLFGSDTQSFALVASLYLAGISLGAIFSKLCFKPGTNFGMLYAQIVFLIAVAYIISTLALLKLVLDPAFKNLIGNFAGAHALMYRATVASLVLLVPTFLIGMALPVAVAANVEKNENAKAVGRVYAFTLLGNVTGLLLTGQIIAVGAGLRTTIFVLGCLAVAGAIVQTIERQQFRSNGRQLALVGLALFVWATGSINLFQTRIPLGVDLANWNVEFYAEGKSNIVSVVSQKQNPDNRRMIIDGVTIGESRGGVDEKQQVLAHLPFLIRTTSHPRRVLTIGLGTGILSGALAANDAVQELICVELSPEVIAACEEFSNANNNIIHHPKTRIEHRDGIHFLQNLDQEVDVIVSDAKSRPGHAGNVAFFSKDYYELCESRLASEGLFVQWISLETASASVRTIVSSFRGTFEFGFVGIAVPDSIYLIGAKKPLEFEFSKMEEYLSRVPKMAAYDWRNADDLASMFWLEQNEMDEPPGRINSFDQPILELYALQSSGTSPEHHKLNNLIWLKRILPSVATIRSGQAKSIADRNNESNWQRIENGREATRQLIDAAILMFRRPENWLDQAGDHAKAAFHSLPGLSRQRFIANLYRQLADRAQANSNESIRFSALLNISEMGLATAEDHFELGNTLKRMGQSSLSLEHLFTATSLAPEHVEYQLEFGFALVESQKCRQALRIFEKLLSRFPENAKAILGQGICQTNIGQTESGWQNIRLALRLEPQLQNLLQKYQSQIQFDHN